MKKTSRNILAAAFFLSATAFTFQSCNDSDDENPATPVGIAQNPDDFRGNINKGETVTLDAAKIYTLTGAVHIKEGGKLIIPAGTKFNAIGGTKAFITVEQGGQIFANGTQTNPVVFTSTSKIPGSWGGLVLCGKAPINRGATATSEVGDATYGGTNSADNSGVLNYVRIEYAGAIHTTEKEFNGLSLFGVGNGTTISNISLINGSDDGIEFFGGTVNVSNIISIDNEDDAFDWTEGWNGTATGVFTKRTNGNRGIEGDNNNPNNNADPRSNPTIKNATFIGSVTGEADGLKLREGTYATIDNVVLSGWKTGINIEHDASVAYFNGKGKVTNVKFENIGTNASVKASSGSTAVSLLDGTYTENKNATGAGNGTATPAWAAGWAGL